MPNGFRPSDRGRPHDRGSPEQRDTTRPLQPGEKAKIDSVLAGDAGVIDELGEEIAKAGGPSDSQFRSFYAPLVALRQESEATPEEAVRKLRLMRPRLAYLIARLKGERGLVWTYFGELLKNVKSAKQIGHVIELAEAVVAYRKFHGTKGRS